MDEWLRELLAVPQSEHPAFAAAPSLIVVVPPDDAVALLSDRLRRIDGERQQLDGTRRAAIEAGVHPLFLIEDDYRLSGLAAEADFVTEFIARMADRGSDWAAMWRAHHGQLLEQEGAPS